MLLKIARQVRLPLRSCSTEAHQIKGTGKNGEITQMDILKWRQEQHKHARVIEVGGQTQKWNYRSELVKRHGLDNNHKYIWIAFGFLIIMGFTSFVAVKTNVIENRRLAMVERERLRKEMKLEGEDRKKIGVVL